VLLWYSKGLVASRVPLERLRVACALAGAVSSKAHVKPFSDGLESNLLQYGVIDSALFLSSSGPHATHVSHVDQGTGIRPNSGGMLRIARLEGACVSAGPTAEDGRVDIVARPSGFSVVSRVDTFYVNSMSPFTNKGTFRAWDEFRRVIRGLPSSNVGVTVKTVIPLLEGAENRARGRSFDVVFDDRIGIRTGEVADLVGWKVSVGDRSFAVHGPTLLEVLRVLPSARIEALATIPVLKVRYKSHVVYIRGRPVERANGTAAFESTPWTSRLPSLPIRSGYVPPFGLATTKKQVVLEGDGASVWIPHGESRIPRARFPVGAAGWIADFAAREVSPSGLRVRTCAGAVPPLGELRNSALRNPVRMNAFLSMLVYFGHVADEVGISFVDGKAVLRAVSGDLSASCAIGCATEFPSAVIPARVARWLHGLVSSAGMVNFCVADGRLFLVAERFTAALDCREDDIPIPATGTYYQARADVNLLRLGLAKVMRRARMDRIDAAVVEVGVVRVRDADFLSVSARCPPRNSFRMPLSEIRGDAPKSVALRENAVRLALGTIQGRRRRTAEIGFHDDGIAVVRRLCDWEAQVRIQSA
jgi:hypothetical protein